MPGGFDTALLERALTIRAVEQRLLALYGEGHLHGTVHTCIGQEWTGVAVAASLQAGDHIVSNHRGHGHYLAWTDDVEGLVAEVMACATGVCLGRGGSQHLCNGTFYSNGIIGGMTPIASGMAFAHKLRDDGGLAVAFVGDGTMGQGVVFEALNIAAVLALPLYMVVEVNGIAQSTPIETVQAGSLGGRAEAFGIATRQSDTWDVAKLLADVREAVATVRKSGRPLVHIVHTARLMSHSKGDDTRAAEEVERLWSRDPLGRMAAEPGVAELRLAAERRVEAAVSAAHSAPPADAGPEPGRVAAQRPDFVPATLPDGRLGDRIRAGIGRAMSVAPEVVILGEDVLSPYGGAFKITASLSDQFPGRVFNMPISEAGIVGVGTGLAMSGYRPVCEIMFGDFLPLALDQLLNHASKFNYLYGGRVTVPVVVRAPMGGRRGYGATHSQCLEKHFLGIPGLTVASVHHRLNAEEFYARVIRHADGPVLLVENKVAYGLDGAAGRVEGFQYLETQGPWPVLLVRPPLPAEVTLVCHGGMLQEVERAVDELFVEHEILAEVVCPTRLYPFDPSAILESVAHTRRLVVVEEGQDFASFGSEVIAQAAEILGSITVRRAGPGLRPVPCGARAEAEHLPGAADIVATVRACFR